MNRRGFLGGLGAVIGVGGVSGAAALAAERPKLDDFIHNGFRVIWRPWVEPVNQAVVVSMWLAKHESQDLQWVSTTTGQCYPSRDFEVVDMTLARGWPLLTAFSSKDDREAAKERAKVALLSKL